MIRLFLLLFAIALVAPFQADAADPAAGKAKYDMLCATCHGATGAGDGVAGGALNPKPRSFVDAEWQKSVTDELIAKAIKDGGAAIGKSPTMPPWGHSLNEEELAGMVALIRSWNPAAKAK